MFCVSIIMRYAGEADIATMSISLKMQPSTRLLLFEKKTMGVP